MFEDDDEVTTPAGFEDSSKTLEITSDIESTTEVAAPVIKTPGRYAGKTQEELAQMLEDAQAHIGRQSSEIGEVRKLADELVKKSLVPPQSKEKPPVDDDNEDDFFTDPRAAVAKAVSKHPAVVRAQEEAEQSARERSQARVKASHPDMAQVIESTDFADWVKASPMRIRMYAQADQYDADAADELLSGFKATDGFKARATTAAAAVASKVSETAIAATLAAGSVGASSTGNLAPPSKKYRRSDIMRLMTNDPQRYEAMADEILKAYSEGRVV